MMIDLPLTDDPVVDASSLSVGLKVGEHAHEQFYGILELISSFENGEAAITRKMG